MQDADSIVRRLAEVEPVPLALALVSMSGDLDLLDRIRPLIRGAATSANSIPRELQLEMANRAAALLVDDPDRVSPLLQDGEVVRRMMSTAVGEEVPAEYVPMLLGQMDLFGDAAPPPRGTGRAPLTAIIIGAGISGVCAAVALGAAGIDYIVIEKNDGVGGTWLENIYPGCAVDTPNHFYQYSFAANSDWSRYFSPQGEILDYIGGVAADHDIRRHVRFGCAATGAAFDEARSVWRVTFTDTTGADRALSADILITAVGQLNRPAVPAIPGLSDFAGPVVHTAEWDPALDLRGRRVALVGTGASAIQVGPAIAAEVEALHVFQRSGAWIARSPNLDRSVSTETRWALRHVPFFAAWYRFQLFWSFADGLFPALRVEEGWEDGGRSVSAINRKLGDVMARYMRGELEGRPDLIEKCTPTYPPYGKRVLQDTGWFRMLRRDNVALETVAIDRCDDSAIVLSDGRAIEVDAIILATGFRAGEMLASFEIEGRGGRRIRDAWAADDPRAYLGIVVPDFPNMFVLFGPNTNLGHGGSAIFLAECQMRYVMSCVAMMIDRDLASIEIRRDVHDDYNRDLDAEMRSLVWVHPSVESWYRNASGRVVTNQPWRLVDYWRLTQAADPDAFVTVARTASTAREPTGEAVPHA